MTSAKQIQRYKRWLLGYGPEAEEWPIVKKAEAYLNRRNGLYRQTQRVVDLVPWPYENVPSERVALLLQQYEEVLRPALWRVLKNKDAVWEHGVLTRRDHTYEEAYTIGQDEIRSAAERPTDSMGILPFVMYTLEYFSDRWTFGRLGRMDAMIDALREQENMMATPNPRYVNYARVHGNSHTEQLTVDAEKYPGGKMTGFILWSTSQLRIWRSLNGREPDSKLSEADYVAYDAYLDALPVKENTNA